MTNAELIKKYGLEARVAQAAAERVRRLIKVTGADLPEEALVLAARGVIRDKRHYHETIMEKLEKQLAALEGRKVFRPKASRGGWE